MEQEKSFLREKFRRIRNDKTQEELKEKSLQLCNLLYELIKEQDSDVLLYAAKGSECDLKPFGMRLLSDGRKIAFPKVVSKTEMDFYYVKNYEELIPGKFGISEPPAENLFVLDGSAIMLVPGLCFDKRGFRVGYGAGYYDRYLSGHNNILTIGTAYDFQVTDKIENDEYDIKLKLGLTNRGIFFDDRVRK